MGSMKCKQTETCFVHEGRHNLKKIRKWVTSINKEWITKLDHPIWKQGITWNLITGGFMETLLNFQFIMKEMIETKELVDKFNETRESLKKYIKEINIQINKKPSVEIKREIKMKPGISKRNPKKKYTKEVQTPTRTQMRLWKKLWKKEQEKDPYTDEEENEIFLQMFRHKEIREYCESSTIFYDNILLTHEKISGVLNSFRKIYEGYYRWSDAKLLNKLREKWQIVETIQEKENKVETEEEVLEEENKVETEEEVLEEDAGI